MRNEDFEIRAISAEMLKIPYGRWIQQSIMLYDAGNIAGMRLLTDFK